MMAYEGVACSLTVPLVTITTQQLRLTELNTDIAIGRI